jgi:hypothetical protein
MQILIFRFKTGSYVWFGGRVLAGDYGNKKITKRSVEARILHQMAFLAQPSLFPGLGLAPPMAQIMVEAGSRNNNKEIKYRSSSICNAYWAQGIEYKNTKVTIEY